MATAVFGLVEWISGQAIQSSRQEQSEVRRIQHLLAGRGLASNVPAKEYPRDKQLRLAGHSLGSAPTPFAHTQR